MASKKEEVIEDSHESLMAEIVTAEKAFNDCKENPLTLPRQPTVHELRLMREKNAKTTNEEHQRANKAAQSAALTEQKAK